MTKELKTKCFNCKGKLYEGKFWIYGFSAKKWCSKKCMAKSRLEALRKILRTEDISYGELAELESLSKYIEAGDVELAEVAGIPEQEFMART